MKKYFFRNYSIIFLIKILILYIFQAQLMPDSNGYIDETKTFFDSIPFRNYGYPSIIYLLSSFFDNWENILCIIQIIFSCFTSFYIFCTTIKLKLSKHLSFFIVLILNLSILLFLDICILPDSLISNLFMIIICNFLRIFIFKHSLFFLIFINGLLFTLCFLLKSQLIYFLPIFILIFVSFYKIFTFKKLLLSLFLFISPTLMTSESIKSLHNELFNHKIINFSDNTIYLYSLIKPFKEFNMQNLNSNEDKFNQILKKNINSEEFSITYKIINDLKNEGYKEDEVSAIIKRKYFETIFYNPEFLLIKIFYNLKPTSIWGIFQPTLSLSQLYSVKNQDGDYWRFRLIFKKFLKNYKINNAILITLIFLEMIFSTYIFLYVFFNSVKKYFNKNNYLFLNTIKLEDFLLLLVFFYYFFILIHLIVHIEPRYLAPVNLIPILAFAFFKNSSKD